MKIIYLIDQPLDQRNYDRFGIQNWIERGWDLEIWDFTPIFYPMIWKRFIESNKEKWSQSFYLPVGNLSHVVKRIETLGNNCYCLDLLTDNYRSIFLRYKINKNHITKILLKLGVIPVPRREIGYVRVLKKIIQTNPIYTFRNLSIILLKKLIAASRANEIFVISGEESMDMPIHGKGELNKLQIIKGHNLDYDLFLRIERSAKGDNCDSIVFLDEDCPFHEDYLYLKISPSVTVDEYYPKVCNALRIMGKKYNCNLFVAAHPRSDYFNKGIDYYEGIPIVYGRTAELIQHSKIVVGHCSTAIQLAVLFQKPIIFITTDELENSFYSEWIKNYASELGKIPINVDKPLVDIDWEREMELNQDKYEDYKRKYIKMDDSAELPLWEIVINELENKGKICNPAN